MGMKIDMDYEIDPGVMDGKLGSWGVGDRVVQGSPKKLIDWKKGGGERPWD